MNKEERILNFENELNFGIETNDGTLYVLKSDVIQAVSDLLDELDQPQLTIPKSIAEQADKIAFYALQKEGVEEFHQWFDYKQDEYMDVVFAYLNPLTRDLVKVV